MIPLDGYLTELLDMYLTTRSGSGFIHPRDGLVVGVPPFIYGAPHVSGEGYPMVHPVPPPFFPVVVPRRDTHDDCCCCSKPTKASVLTDDLKSKIAARLQEIDASLKNLPRNDPKSFRQAGLINYVKKVLATKDLPDDVISFINEKLR